MNTDVRIFGYLVAVAGVARSLASDSTKIFKINTAILAAYWTRLLAAATVNRGPSDARPDLPRVGDGRQLLWADALSRKGVRGEIIWSCSFADFCRLMRLDVTTGSMSMEETILGEQRSI